MMGIATQLEQAVDGMLLSYVTSKSSALTGILSPLVLTCVTIYVLMMGYAIMRGEAHDALHTFLWKVFKMAFIAGLALSTGEYQGTVIQAIQGLQEGMTQAMSGVTSIGQLIDNMSQPFDELGQALWSQATIGFWPNLGLIAAAGMVAVGQFLLFGCGLGMYLLSKVVLALILAVGPIFIACALFPATQKYTESWIGQALHYVLLNVLIAASVAMLTDFASQFAAAMKGNVGATNVIQDASALLLASSALAVVMLNLNQLASALSGGVSIQGIGREIGRAFTQLARGSGPGSAAAASHGGEIRGRNDGGTHGPGSSRDKATPPIYQRNVISNLRNTSNQGVPK